MPTKTKPRAKGTKKAGRSSSAASKSVRLKGKQAKSVSRNGSKTGRPVTSRRPPKVESRRSPVAASLPASSAQAERARSKQFDSAVQAYEAGIKLMHADEITKARKCFEDLIAEHPDEPEIQERAKVLIHVCEKKIQEKSRTVLKSADDYYNIAIAELNRRELASAIEHLQSALKLMPKGDHILYALATANALKGDRDPALQYLKQSIQHRGENRFLAARDSDFESLQDDAEFKQLVAHSEK